jgi:hypothetical protein
VFGIKKGTHVLCHGLEPGHMAFLPRDFVTNPVLKESAYEIDQLMQSISVGENDYTLTVFEVDDEQAQIYVINRLKGY